MLRTICLSDVRVALPGWDVSAAPERTASHGCRCRPRATAVVRWSRAVGAADEASSSSASRIDRCPSRILEMLLIVCTELPPRVTVTHQYLRPPDAHGTVVYGILC